jgi:hypothetical protein
MSRDTIREESNSEFIRHDKCNHCPSSDAVAVYADGHGHCFSCDWTGSYEGVLNLTEPNLRKIETTTHT